MANLRKYYRMLGWYARMDAVWFLRDTRITLLAMAADWIANLASIAGIFLLAWQFDGIGDMGRDEVLFMLGFITVVSGIYELRFTCFNVGHISRRIGRGQLEHMMLQPVPIWMQLLTEGFIPVSGSSNLVCGIAITAVAIGRLGLQVTPGFVALFLVQALGSVALLLGFSYLFSTAAFYAPVAAEEISSDVFMVCDQLKRYPLSGMPGPVQWTLCTLLPSGLMGWFPACVLLGAAPLGLPPLFVIYMAAIVWAAALILFWKGWRYYVRTGINRYSAFGHRR